MMRRTSRRVSVDRAPFGPSSPTRSLPSSSVAAGGGDAATAELWALFEDSMVQWWLRNESNRDLECVVPQAF